MARASALRGLYAKLAGDSGLESVLGGSGRIVGDLARERPAAPYVVLGVGPEDTGDSLGLDKLTAEIVVVAPDVFKALDVVDALDAALGDSAAPRTEYTGHSGTEWDEGLVTVRVTADVWEEN